MKKLSFMIMLIFAMVNFGVFAEGGATVSLSEAEAKPGDKVDITVSLSENPGIISMLLEVDYDDGVLTLTDVKDAGVFGEALHSDNFDKSPYFLYWSNGAAEEDFMINGVVATLTFTVSKNAKAGDYPVKVSYSKEDDGIFNFNFEDVDFKMVNGKVTVAADESEDASDDGDDAAEAADNDSEEEITREPGEILVMLDGKYLKFADQKPVIKDDRTLVPLRAIFEALGADVDWDGEKRLVTAKRGDITISLAIDSDQLYVNGEAKTIDVPAQIINDRTMVPIRAIAESFGCNVGWDGETKTVTISN